MLIKRTCEGGRSLLFSSNKGLLPVLLIGGLLFVGLLLVILGDWLDAVLMSWAPTRSPGDPERSEIR
jgi:hypothetical protein